jgi:hypothetical protein
MSSKIKRKQIDLTLSEGPTDGTYGVTNSANISNNDTMEDAFDKVTAILDALVPPNAPILSSTSESITGVAGKLSFGSINTVTNYDNHPTLNINGTYNVSGNAQGIIPANQNITGVLANTTAVGSGTPNPAYVANAFSPGNSGSLQLKLDGVVIHTVDLSTFGSGSSLNGNGSGFTLSAATSALFPQGTPFPSFKYRTGSWTVNQAEWASNNRGYKTIQITHVTGSGSNNTQTYDFIVDGNTGVITASGALLDNLVMAGSRYLSGVQYHQSGSAQYDVTLSGVYPYTYSPSASAISFNVTNGSATAQAIPNLTTNENDTVVITNKTVNVNNTSVRILGAPLTISTSVLRTVQSTATGLGNQSAFAILLDTINTGSTDTAEQFNTETYRMTNAIESNKDNIVGYASGGTNPYSWSSIESLVGANALYNNGMLIFNGLLRYPNNTTGTSVTSGNFGAVTNAPVGNPNYSTATGNRVYYRYYYLPSKSNFVMNVTATSTTFVNAATSPSGNNLNIQILAPSQTKNGSSVTEWKDCVTAYTADSAIGAYNASGGANVGNIAGAAWGLTIGTKTTANSGNVIILKITASASWTGTIDTINIA